MTRDEALSIISAVARETISRVDLGDRDATAMAAARMMFDLVKKQYKTTPSGAIELGPEKLRDGR